MTARLHGLLQGVLVCFLLSCGGSGGSKTEPKLKVTLTVDPAKIGLNTAEAATFVANVWVEGVGQNLDSDSRFGFRWSVTGGSLSPYPGQDDHFKVYTAPTQPGNYQVSLHSTYDPSVVVSSAIQVALPPKITSFSASANPTSVDLGSELTPVFEAGTGIIEPGVGPVISGMTYKVKPQGDVTYRLVVTNAVGRTVAQDLDLKVFGPIVVNAFGFPDGAITSGDATRCVWNTSGATEVWFGGDLQRVDPIGSIIVDPFVTTTYRLKATNPFYMTEATAELSVFPYPSPLGFRPSHWKMEPGQRVVLPTTFVGGSATVSPGIGDVATGGSFTVTPLATTSYALEVTNPLGVKNTAVATVQLQAPGEFVLGPSMARARVGHTLSRLPDGRVLIAGGRDSTGPMKDTEIYDPASRILVAGQLMRETRAEHTATVLADGSVLLVGGAVASAERFNPTTGTFETVGSMSQARSGHTATLLESGKVLISGGDYSDGSAELFDPVSKSFAPAGTMTEARTGHAATRLGDGRVLLTGGGDVSNASRTAEIFNPLTGTFQRTGDLNAPRRLHASVLLADGKVLIAGGVKGASDYAMIQAAEIFDPATGQFAEVSATGWTPRGSATATALPDGRVLMVDSSGGEQHQYGPLFHAFMYYPVQGVLAPVCNLVQQPRSLQVAQLLSDGTVLLVGGRKVPASIWEDQMDEPISSLEVFNPNSGTPLLRPTPGPVSRVSRHDYSANLLHDGTVLIVGGEVGGRTHPELFLPEAGALVRIPSRNRHHRSGGHSATTLQDGRVLIAGGVFDDGTGYPPSTSSTELYYPSSRTFEPCPPLHSARRGHSATLLRNGQVLLAGGYTFSSGSWVGLSSSELFDPLTNTFSTVGSMASARAGHCAVLLPNGKVLIIGGSGDSSTSVEVFDPTTRTFSDAGTLTVARSGGLDAALLPSGKVLIVGGESIGVYDPDPGTVEVYDPATATSTFAGKPLIQRWGQQVVVLPDGQVLVLGGRNQNGGFLQYVERYDPVRGTFSLNPPKSMSGHLRAAIPKADGSLLVFLSDSHVDIWNIASVEIFR